MKSDIQHKLQALFAAYSKSLPDKIKNIHNQWEQLKKQWDKDAFILFHREVHNISGSSATYGYSMLAKASRNLEIFLKSLLEKEQLNEEEQRQLNQLVQTLQTVLEQQTPEQFVANNLPLGIQEELFIYVLANSVQFGKELQRNIDNTTLKLLEMNNAEALIQAASKKLPLAFIIDLDSLNDQECTLLSQFFHEKASIPLFCIANSGDILTRLQAIRLGSTDFFQKPVDQFLLAKRLNQMVSVSSSEPYRILIIDDSESFAEYYALILKEAGMIVRYITNPLMLIESIDDFQPDLLLMDVYMPQCTGLELASLLRQEPQYTHIPIIFLSTEDDRFKQLFALNLGGDDFLVKPVEPQHLIHVITSRSKRARILGSLMIKDNFTGLYNHTNIMQRLDSELARAQRNNQVLSFIMLDIDHFKHINDNFGHPIGDEVIRKISHLLITSFRKTDIVGRYGGEEFAIVLPEASLENSFRICDNFRMQIEQLEFKSDDNSFHITISAGIACYPNLKDLPSLVNAADKALYLAKHNGRNQVVIFK